MELPELRFFNTLSKSIQTFKPLSGGKEVLMYNCGPTVYDYATIGNLRSYVFADTIRRILIYAGYDVNQVINITDFGHLVSDADEGEDKMSKGLAREGMALTLENMHILAEKYAEAFIVDLARLSIDTPTIRFPRASAYIPKQIELIEQLLAKDYAYKTTDGVYFDTKKFKGYGKLGSIKIADQQQTDRVENSHKHHPADFVLWKSDAKIGWESPWGLGFPGWHIECTAMIFELLGKQIDIHTGGIDHIPVHHNNEIAQAESLTGTQFAQIWMHNEFITIDAKRLGKSVGNAITLQEVIDRGINPLALRYWYLTAHYRSPANFTWEALEAANTARNRLAQMYKEYNTESAEAEQKFKNAFLQAIGDDLDTPKALALTWDYVKSEVSHEQKFAALQLTEQLLGLKFSEYLDKNVSIEEHNLPYDVKILFEERGTARALKDFSKADDLRKKINELGYDVSDTKEGGSMISKL